MNILFVVYKIGKGGAERVSVTLAEYLKQRGHTVRFACYTDDGTYPLDREIPIHLLPDSSNFFVKHVKRIAAFIKLCKTNKIDLVIALYRGYDYTWIYKTFFGGRLILSQRNDPKAEYDNDRSAWLQSRLFFSGADAVVFQTYEEQEYFPRHIAEKGRVIANPIKGSLREPYNGKRKRLAVNFCRLEPQKNLKLLVDAFSIVVKQIPDYQLKIYGEGSLRDELTAYIEKQNLSNNIQLLPFSTQIHEEIRDAGMFVSSSDYEGISNTMMEAMALGLPCVCTDCPAGGARLVIQNEQNGLLVPVGHKQALAEAMMRLIKEPELADRLGQEARQVREDYSSEKICSRWETLIEEVMRGRF